jgi:hypothetical protein
MTTIPKDKSRKIIFISQIVLQPIWFLMFFLMLILSVVNMNTELRLKINGLIPFTGILVLASFLSWIPFIFKSYKLAWVIVLLPVITIIRLFFLP